VSYATFSENLLKHHIPTLKMCTNFLYCFSFKRKLKSRKSNPFYSGATKMGAKKN